MRKAQNEAARLQARELQDRQWHAPLPDVTALPRLSDSNSMRLEWDTRDTMSNRHWTQVMDAGPTQVTAAALAAHPTGGAEPFMPGSARQDQRTWYPGPDVPPETNRRPPQSLFQNAWTDGFDVEGGGAARELRSVVREDNRHRFEDVSARLAGRTFEHQWIPATVTKQIANQQIDAAVRLRPVSDNYWRGVPQ
jgi:hypothetical protein